MHSTMLAIVSGWESEQLKNIGTIARTSALFASSVQFIGAFLHAD